MYPLFYAHPDTNAWRRKPSFKAETSSSGALWLGTQRVDGTNALCSRSHAPHVNALGGRVSGTSQRSENGDIHLFAGLPAETGFQRILSASDGQPPPNCVCIEAR